MKNGAGKAGGQMLRLLIAILHLFNFLYPLGYIVN